jgi:hypothetical protein
MKIPSLSEIPDLVPVEGGEEHPLKVTKCFEQVSKKTGRSGLCFAIEIADEALTPPIYHKFWLPMEGDDKAYIDRVWRDVKAWLLDLGFDVGIEYDDLTVFDGTEFRGIVGLRDSALDGRPENFVQRIV